MRSGAAVTMTLSNGALRNEVGRRCNDDFVERCVLGPAEITVPDANLDVGVAFSFEPLHCFVARARR